jgi:hydroxymethylpyrimidine pyrophosphatase-like HAD family hydrolase/D-arabinose 5-phosphate isomerase GutQ
MGRPYAIEMSQLPHTVHFANGLSLGDLPGCLNQARHNQVILVGAGGSLSAAEFGRQLFDQCGVLAHALTPLALLQSKANLTETALILLSASGNNKDVKAVLSNAISRHAKQVLIICASKKSKLAKMGKAVARVTVFDFDLPSGRDGYLATNSLLATCIVLARAMGATALDAKEVEAWVKSGEKGYAELNRRRHRDHYIIMHSNWSKSAATDLESKLSEAGLASSMPCDYRHFAHGRHNWIAKQGTRTGVVAFNDPDDKLLADKTTRLLPAKTPVWKCSTTQKGATGALQQILAGFGFVGSAGKARGIDPGRPGVPSFGSKTYSLGPVGLGRSVVGRKAGFDKAVAVDRKMQAGAYATAGRAEVEQKCEEFCSRLTKQSFGAIVTDYDGTLVPVGHGNDPLPESIQSRLLKLLEAGVQIFFATGRGDSVHGPLNNAFPSELRHLVHVGHYNGAFCLTLSQSDTFNELNQDTKVFAEIEKCIKRAGPFANVKIQNKGCQLSLRPPATISPARLMPLVQACLASHPDRSFRAVASTHSIDIITQDCSKKSCLTKAAESVGAHLQVLALGDCGAYPGNDFELLTHPFSLSVDVVSYDLDTCWNLLPGGLGGPTGTEHYLDLLRLKQGRFSIG